jgi:hypothetical protein
MPGVLLAVERKTVKECRGKQELRDLVVDVAPDTQVLMGGFVKEVAERTLPVADCKNSQHRDPPAHPACCPGGHEDDRPVHDNIGQRPEGAGSWNLPVSACRGDCHMYRHLIRNDRR